MDACTYVALSNVPYKSPIVTFGAGLACSSEQIPKSGAVAATEIVLKYGVPSSCPLQPLRRHLPTEPDPITGAILIGTLILHATTAYLDINPSDDIFLIPHAPTTTRSVCSALLLRPHTSISALHLLVSLSSRRATLYVLVPPESRHLPASLSQAGASKPRFPTCSKIEACLRPLAPSQPATKLLPNIPRPSAAQRSTWTNS